MTQEQIQECNIIIHYFTNLVAFGKANYDPDDELFSEKKILPAIAIALAEVFCINIPDDINANIIGQAFRDALDKGVQRRTLGAIAQAYIHQGAGDIVAAATSASFIETAGWILADKIADMAKKR